MNFQTIEDRAKQTLERWRGRTIQDAEMIGDMAAMMRALLDDCLKISNQYWNNEEINRGCELCNVAYCITGEISTLIDPKGRPESICEARRRLEIQGKA